VTLKRSIQSKSPSPFRISLGPALFRLDDVRDLYEGLREFSEGYDAEPASEEGPTIELRAGDNAIAEEIEDLREATPSELREVSLILSMPKIKIDLHAKGAEVIAESDTPTIRRFAEDVKKFTTHRNSRITGLRRVVRRNWTIYILLALYLYLTYAPLPWWLDYWFGGSGTFNTAVLIAVIAASIAVTVRQYLQLRDPVRIVPIWRKDGRRITAETRRALIVGIAGAIVLGLLGFWAGVFVKK
jgi:hypothetical protein